MHRYQVAALQIPRPAPVRKSETIRNVLNHISEAQRHREKSLGAFNLPGIMFENGHSDDGVKGCLYFLISSLTAFNCVSNNLSIIC